MFNANLENTKDEYGFASRGIRNPTVALLSAGEMIFRFASSKKATTGASIPSTQWARGAWWVPEDGYREIIRQFQKGKLGLGTVGRSAAAVQPSWSLMDVSIKAELVDDIKVYIGKGSTQYRDMLPNGMFVTSHGWSNITQIYIPGMRGSSISALRIIRQKIITTDNFGFPHSSGSP